MLENINTLLFFWVKKNDVLLTAVKKNNIENIKRSLKEGENINIQDDQGSTPLHWAAAHGYITIAEYLVQQGANVNTQNNHGQTPLHWAAAYGYITIVKHLVQQKANVNTQDNCGRTPLHWAAWHGYSEIAQHLVQQGACVTIVDSFSCTALHRAVQKKQLVVVDNILKKIEKIENIYIISLKEKQLPVINIRDENGQTPLHWAAWHGYSDIAEHLVQQGANVNIQDTCGRTPLHWAALLGYSDIAQHLVQQGACVNIVDNFGFIAESMNFNCERSSAEAVLSKVSRGISTLSLLIFKLFCSTPLYGEPTHQKQISSDLPVEKSNVEIKIAYKLIQHLNTLGHGYDNGAFTPDAPLPLQVEYIPILK